MCVCRKNANEWKRKAGWRKQRSTNEWNGTRHSTQRDCRVVSEWWPFWTTISWVTCTWIIVGFFDIRSSKKATSPSNAEVDAKQSRDARCKRCSKAEHEALNELLLPRKIVHCEVPEGPRSMSWSVSMLWNPLSVREWPRVVEDSHGFTAGPVLSVSSSPATGRVWWEIDTADFVLLCNFLVLWLGGGEKERYEDWYSVLDEVEEI
jgi:hypothetical protein